MAFYVISEERFLKGRKSMWQNFHICFLGQMKQTIYSRRFFLQSQIAKNMFSLFMNGNSYVPHISFAGTHLPPFTFSLFAGAKNHTLFCSCYNPLLIFFIITVSSLGRRQTGAEKNDCTNESSLSTEVFFNRKKGLCFLFNSFAPPTVLVVSRKIIFLPFFSYAVLLFYVNLIMYSFQWLRKEYDAKKTESFCFLE